MKNDLNIINELLDYPATLKKNLAYFTDTSQIKLPDDPIERVIFQDRGKAAIRKIAQNKGHILMIGKPGTGKSMLANMFNQVLEESLGDYLRPKSAIIAYPGKDQNHIRFSYENPKKIDQLLINLNERIESARNNVEGFNLQAEIKAVRKVRNFLLLATFFSVFIGFFFPTAFIFTGLVGMGSIFMFMQENNHKAQEKMQQETHNRAQNEVKHLSDMVPEVLYDPRNDKNLMVRVAEPDARNMKGGFRHDPYQSGNLHTPPHKRAFLGAHAKASIIYLDELKTIIKAGYMADLLEIMQNKKYILEGGKNAGSGSADKAENHLKAKNIIISCCNYDTLEYLQKEGDGAFLSRIEDKGEIIHLESSVQETPDTIRETAQYIKQEIEQLGCEFKETWGEVIEKEGYEGVKKRSEIIFSKALPDDYQLKEREFSRNAVMEIIKELRCRSGDGKLSSILRPINGIIKTAEYEAILDNSALVGAGHVRKALKKHLSLESALALEVVESRKDLKKYISAMTDSIGYVVGLAVIQSKSSGKMIGQPLPIHCQIISGVGDKVVAPGKIGEIAKAAAQNVRASIKKVLKKVGAPYLGQEMHIEYIQAHSGVEGDSASVAMDIALVSDYIKKPVSQQFGVTGSLTGDIILAVGGVTEKLRSIMDPDLDMDGAVIPWQNKHDVEPLLINTEAQSISNSDIPGIRIFRESGSGKKFDIYFCRTKYHAYKILMGLDKNEVEQLIAERSLKDFEFMNKIKTDFLSKKNSPSKDLRDL